MRPGTALTAVLALPALVALAGVGGGAAETVRDVRVVNFPPVQKVEGAVSIDGPVSHARLIRLEDVTVPPVEPSETGRLIDGGVFETDGFTSTMLSLSGRAIGRALRSGDVGVLLVPDEESIQKVFEEDGSAQFPIALSAPLTQKSRRLTASAQERFRIAFPRYRVRLYNTTDKTVRVNLYAYLTN